MRGKRGEGILLIGIRLLRILVYSFTERPKRG